MKVRIRKTPDVVEVDGVRVDDMKPGSIREVSASIGAWLIAEQFAEPEMRRAPRAYEDDFLVGRETADDRVRTTPRRRSNER